MWNRVGALFAALLTSALCMQGCSSPPVYAGPGCRIDLYTLPYLQGYGLPIVRDTPEMSEAWGNAASLRESDLRYMAAFHRSGLQGLYGRL